MLVPRFMVVVALVVAPTCAAGQSSDSPPHWGALSRLIGTWVADAGSGGPLGIATRGGETWQLELDGHVLVRRDFSEYPATGARSAFRHEGLTVIAPAAEGGFAAHAYDNEQHKLDYEVNVTDTAIVFTSKGAPDRPQFRLTYEPVSAGYAVRFEIAAPDQPGRFRTYVSGGLHRAP